MAQFKVKLTDDELLNIVKADISSAENYFNSEILPKLQEWQNLYFANEEYYQQLMPVLSQQSKFISKDVASAIEWILPQLTRIFLGSDDVVVIRGRTADDVKKAQIMQKLVNYQINVENNAFMVFYRWMKDALINGCGILKGIWHREYKEKVEEDYVGLEQFNLLSADPNIEIINYELIENVNPEEEYLEPEPTYRVKYKVKNLADNKPLLFNIRPEHFGFDPLATSMDDANFCYHKKLVDADYLRRKKDIFKNVEKAIENGQANLVGNTYATYSQNLNMAQLNDPSGTQEARKKFWLYEYYGRIDVNKDGLLENVVIFVCNDVILAVQENTYEMFPFFVISPIIEPYKFWGRGYGDVIGQLQNLKTMLIREIIINISQSNNGRLIVNQDFVNINDLLGNSKYIRVRGNMQVQNVFTPFPFQQIHQATFPLLEFIEVTKENEQGITRYSQGLDAQSLNKRIDINTPVPMADGTWKLLGEIKDGDWILGGNGIPTKVIKAHEIAMSEVAYELEFSNGAKIVADGEHLWGVYVHNRYKVLNSNEIKKLFEEGKPLRIPRPERILSGDYKDLPIDPYVLGVWLGDGHKYSSRITLEDEEIIERVKAWLEEQGWELKEDKHQNSGKAKTYLITSCKNRERDELGRFKSEDSFHKRLSDLDIYPRTGGEPHIPDIYFRASYAQRLELLRGLMDTDGCASKNINIFCTSNRRLAEDVMKLIKSLGGNPHLKQARKKSKDICMGKECNVKEHWHINFNISDCPFYLSRKAKKWIKPKKQKTYRIVNIKKVENRLMRCLTVDNPDGLWLVGEYYITTHNTATGISLIMNAAQQRIELVARIFAETGFRRLFRFLVESNIKFIQPFQIRRITEEDFDIDTSDLSGKYDLIVNAGMGMSSKQQQIQQLQLILQLAVQTLLPLRLVTPENIRNIVKRLLEEMGYKDIGQFLATPEQIQQEQQMMMQQQMAAQQQQAQGEQAPQEQGNEGENTNKLAQLLAMAGGQA